MIDTALLETLKTKKNLLAFSAGVDSSALFFLLLEHQIDFDIAFVNYGTRENSIKEEEHARSLAKIYGMKCYVANAPTFDTRFEEKARAFRYGFFEEIIQKEGYDTLLTAHQMNDQLEWLLMRLSRGAGLSELLGLHQSTHKENYEVVRPLLKVTKDELLDYLELKGHPYFIDESNEELKYERNYFRKTYSDPLIEEFKEGIRRSIRYLKEDQKRLEGQFELLYAYRDLRIIKLHSMDAKVHAVDITLKQLGYLMSAAQREELDKNDTLVIGGIWAVELQNDLLYLSPYSTAEMTKKFKEECRIGKVPHKIRPYCFEKRIDISLFGTFI